MIGVRVFRDNDSEDDWASLPIVAYLPTFLSDPDANNANIQKRLKLLYFDTDASIIKIRWHFQEEQNTGYWFFREA